MNSKNPETASTSAASKGAKKYRDTGAETARILIAPRRGGNAIRSNIQPLSAVGFKSKLDSIKSLEVIKTLKSTPNKLSPMSFSGDEASDIHVCNVDPAMLDLIKSSAPAEMIIEPDHLLQYGDAMQTQPVTDSPISLLAATTTGSQQIQLQVIGDNNKPLSNISVVLTGDAFPSKGATDENGEVTLELFSLPGNPAKSLFLVPQGNYWNMYLTEPSLSTKEINRVKLKSLASTVPNFPQQYPYGWGGRKMGLDQLPKSVTGAGVKVAIIDSGCDTDHVLLRHIKHGKDLTDGATSTSWQTDTVGHGTHVSGTISASGEKDMLRGFVPNAEIHELKVFPGGRFSSLLEALDYCIANDIDIVNMSLGSPNASEAVEQKLEEAYMNGIFLIAAAGNSGGAVQFPALSSYTMAVGAIGLENEYPQDSWDARTIQPQFLTPDGVFSPNFSCFGPQITVSAPGVAILSTVPNNSYDAKSGTSMAAPHIAGAAAVLLAHHPIFKNTLTTRSPERIAAINQLMRSVSMAYPFGPERAGYGMPRIDLVQELKALAEQSEQAQVSTNAAQNILFQPNSGAFSQQMRSASQPRQYPVVPPVTWVAQPNGYRQN